MTTTAGAPGVVSLRQATVRLPGGRVLLAPLDWEVAAGESWAVLGANGAGKSTLLSLVAAQRHPSAGLVTVLGHRLGQVDLRELRRRIGLVAQPADGLPLTVAERVLTGVSASEVVLHPRQGAYTAADRARVAALVAQTGVPGEQRVSSLSAGERRLVEVARALAAAPELLVLDEPAAALDVPHRERLLRLLEGQRVTTVHVTHHLEELPATTSHALLLRAGEVVAQGRVDDVLTDGLLSRCLGLAVVVARHGGRWSLGVRE